jgi:FkbM family methyltransferase
MNRLQKLLTVFRFIATHPFSKHHRLIGWSRFVYWQVWCLFSNKPLRFRFTQHSKLTLAKGLKGASGNYYCGLHEFEEMSFIIHCLRPGDEFVDIGANIGSYTVLAAAEAGAKTIAAEPVPSTFLWLQKNITLNNIEGLVTAKQTAISNKTGEVFFTKSYDAENHMLFSYEEGCITVPVTTIDELVKNSSPTIIKIDVEGYEAFALAGAANTLAKKTLKAVIIEMTDSKMPGKSITSHEYLLGLGYQPYKYLPYQHRMEIETTRGHNTIYVSDIAWINERIQTSPPFRLWNKLI